MNIKPNEIMEEFARKLAEREATGSESTPWHGAIELEKAAQPLETDGRVVYQENVIAEHVSITDDDINILKEKKHPVPIQDMIELAHPESVVISNSLGDGGLVENQNEQHAKMVEIVNKLPSGNHIHLYASEIIDGLYKIAEQMESDGHSDRVRAVDEAMLIIAHSLKKKDPIISKALAFAPIAWGVGAAVSLLGPPGIAAILGIEQDLQTDTADLVRNIQGWINDSEYQASRPIINQLYSAAQSMDHNSNRIIYLTSQLGASTTRNPKLETELDKLMQSFGTNLDIATRHIDILATRYPGLIHLDFVRTQGLVRDIAGGFSKLPAAAASGAAAATRERQKSEFQKKIEQEKAEFDQPGKPAQKAKLPVDERKRVAEIQRLLTGNPKINFGNIVYTIVTGPVPTDGTLEDNTKDALDMLTRAIIRRLRVGNLYDGGINRLYGANANQIRALITFAKDPNPMIGQHFKVDPRARV